MKKVTNPLKKEYIVGFTDGEGCFTLHINKRARSPFGLFFSPSFSLSQNTTSVCVLEEIQSFFGCGFIRPDRKTSKFEVRDLENLQQKIIPFFQKNQLRTQKSQDFALFCEICKLLEEKQHHSFLGVVKLIDLAYSMNQSGAHRRKSKAQLLRELEQYKPKNLR